MPNSISPLKFKHQLGDRASLALLDLGANFAVREARPNLDLSDAQRGLSPEAARELAVAG